MQRMENFRTLLSLTELSGSIDHGEIVGLISSSQLAWPRVAFSLLLVFSVYL